MSTFRYQPLDLKSSAFRLVRLLKGDGNEDIECKLIHTTLDENVIPYEAVSYTWGTSAKPLSITLQGQRYMVTRNLWGLLKSIRQIDADRYIWIDAIAINQDDNLERGHQVQRMQTIYGGAEHVIIYLGEATSSTEVLMQSLLILQSQASGCRWAPDDEKWQIAWEQAQNKLQSRFNGTTLKDIQQEGLKELLERSWFRRVWILQEVANARRALVYCGQTSIKAQVFAMAPSLLEVELDDHVAAVFELMPSYSGKIARKVHSGDFCSILIDFRGSEASDPRDKIFALIGLCEEQDAKTWIDPNYAQTESDVVRTTLFYLMGTYKQLQFELDQLRLEIDRLQSKVNGLCERTLSRSTLYTQPKITHPKSGTDNQVESGIYPRAMFEWRPQFDQSVLAITRLYEEISQLYLKNGHNAQFMSEIAHLKSKVVESDMKITRFEQKANHQVITDDTIPDSINRFLSDLTCSSEIYIQNLLVNMFNTWDVEAVVYFLNRRENAIGITLGMVAAAESSKSDKLERMSLLIRHGRLSGFSPHGRLPPEQTLNWCKTCIPLLRNLEALIETYSWSYEYVAEWIWQEDLYLFLLFSPKPFLERLARQVFQGVSIGTRERLPKSQRIMDGQHHNIIQQGVREGVNYLLPSVSPAIERKEFIQRVLETQRDLFKRVGFWPQLFTAILLGETEIVEHLLKENPGELAHPGNGANLAFREAIDNGHETIIQCLHGMDPLKFAEKYAC
ncbi:heterokaryon incompatibility protein-domain-containing protein [Xylaria venustula]|nr:heterokaryon incompatibility protein-domain-containing protein [Xylaria venustula]